MPEPRVGLYGQRPSKCADESRRAEFAEIMKLSPRERVLPALRLGRRRRLVARSSAAE